MFILGIRLSRKASQLIQSIEQNLSKPVRYRFTDERKTQCYGQCDPWQPDAYYVYSSKKLLNVSASKKNNIPFETNILHELFHLCQIEDDFPHTGTIITPQASPDPILDKLGELVCSSILDLGVDARLKEHEYTSAYFYKDRIRTAKQILPECLARLTKIDFIQYACMLVCLNLAYDGESMDDLLSIVKAQNIGLASCVQELSTEIAKIGYTDAESAFRSLVLLFDAFNLWSTHNIIFHGTFFPSLSDVQSAFPDIHTLAPRT